MTTSVDADVIVIGAGPAGALAAWLCAKRGLSTTLLDKATFPRNKICGGCLSGAGVRLLHDLQLDGVLERSNAVATRTVVLRTPGASARCPFPGYRIVARDRFDAELLDDAAQAGVNVRGGTNVIAVRPGADHVMIITRSRHGESSSRATAVIVAAGLGARLLDHEPSCARRTMPGARIGIGAMLPSTAASIDEATLMMSIGSCGYVGLVRLHDGRLDCAAALDPPGLRRAGGPSSCIAALLDRAGVSIDLPADVHWTGTPELTYRRSSFATRRTFIIGDAATYAEPLTGQGMTWAMTAACAVTPLVEAGVDAWTDDLIHSWNRTMRRCLLRRRMLCQVSSRLARSVRASTSLSRLLHRCPALARPLMRPLDRPIPPRLVPLGDIA